MLASRWEEVGYFIHVCMISGVVASSISGVLRAIDAKMDITGAILLAFVTANAGGTIRDIILGTQIFWINEQFYIWLTFTIGAATYILIYYRRKFLASQMLHTALFVTDAIGLAAFCLAGTQKAFSFGQSYIITITMGICTAVGGGVVADIVSNKVPMVFAKELYITVALTGSICYLVLINFLDSSIAGLISIFLMIIFRLCSIKYQWDLPAIRLKDD